MRDAINSELELNAQRAVEFQYVPRNGTFAAKDEWIQVIADNQSDTPLTFLTGSSFVYLTSEPVFVSGAQSFKMVNANGGAKVFRAPRQELLARSEQRDFSKFGSQFLQAYNSGGALLVATGLAVTDWVYLDKDLNWSVATIGTLPNGAPFGFDVPPGAVTPQSILRPELSGRYYEIDMVSTASVGSSSNFLVHRFQSGLVASISLTGGGAGNPSASFVRVGDDYSALEGTAPFSQKNVLGSANWTIAITNNVAANISCDLRVIRLGY